MSFIMGNEIFVFKTEENMSLNDTPRSNRLHIGLFGKRNSGKSSLINALTHQQIAVVSDVAGTTTDSVYKSMEIHGIGPCVFIDTPGFDDEGALGNLRVEQTKKALEKTDLALVLFHNEPIDLECNWIKAFEKKNIPVIAVISQSDLMTKEQQTNLIQIIKKNSGLYPVVCSANDKESVETVRREIINALPFNYEKESITGELAKSGDVILLVMPQDIQAPKGRLILPQVQVLRELLDKKCIILSTTADTMESALSSLSKDPDLIITDSQVFKSVYKKKPAQSKLTSFSVLFAGYKGDLPYYLEGAKAIEALTPHSRVLIAEACTHAPLSEDIGREKLPRLLRQRIGNALTIDVVSGVDFPKKLHSYDLIIQCGACMFNRQYVLSRIGLAKEQEIPMTNYGVALAYLSGILDFIDF
ncbi:[FeFe] hydrogenase H-cluster maturation GTPase HydF [Anaerovorax sp. IOR16]|uniref:[FeFe] hydrogenase H-cluster maturation GTPase HydF n=1 Tax=Anaerovorax sp. IOR16 TaxID=2773458 RepID=UPI002ED1BD25